MGYYPIVHGVDEQAQAGENSNARDDKHDGIAHRTPRRQQCEGRCNQRDRWK